jgi:hypothetical protein
MSTDVGGERGPGFANASLRRRDYGTPTRWQAQLRSATTYRRRDDVPPRSPREQRETTAENGELR